MAIIGAFTKSDGVFIGTIKTMTLDLASVQILPGVPATDKSPDYRVLAGTTELGMAWKRTASRSRREYLSVKLDDPSFPAPIHALLLEVENGDGFTLVWSR